MLELSEFYEEPNRIPAINSDIYSFDIFALTLSDIKKGEFAQHYHFVCKLCKDIPIIKFIRRMSIYFIASRTHYIFHYFFLFLIFKALF